MTASVQADSFLTLHYRISTLAGEEFLSTFDMSPATLQMGSGQLAESLEEVLLGLEQGGHYVFELEPEQAFGQPNPRLVERIARNALPAGMELKENSIVEFTAPTGAAFSGFLRELNDTSALFDFNHPLAGKAIRFEVKLIGVMSAICQSKERRASTKPAPAGMAGNSAHSARPRAPSASGAKASRPAEIASVAKVNRAGLRLTVRR